MLEDRQLQNLMKKVTAGVMPATQLLEIHTEPAFDTDGQEAVRFTLVVTDEAARTLTGAKLANLLLDLHDNLLREGDGRFPLISYATPTDRGEPGDED